MQLEGELPNLLAELLAQRFILRMTFCMCFATVLSYF